MPKQNRRRHNRQENGSGEAAETNQEVKQQAEPSPKSLGVQNDMHDVMDREADKETGEHTAEREQDQSEDARMAITGGNEATKRPDQEDEQAERVSQIKHGDG